MKKKIWYTYLIGWRDYDRWYYGYRGSPNPESDLWNNYYTSSVYVQDVRKILGEPDVVKLHKFFPTKKLAKYYEDKFHERVNAVRSPRWINRCRAGKDFFNPGVYSDLSREKMRQARYRNGCTRKKPFSEEELARARDNLKFINENELNKNWTAERRANLSKSMMGNQSRKGQRNSPSHREKISAAKKISASIRVSCVNCKVEMSLIGMRKHLVTTCAHPTKKSQGS